MGFHALLAHQLRWELDRLGDEISSRLADGRGAVLCQATYSFATARDGIGNDDPRLSTLSIYDPGLRDSRITALSPRYALLSNAFPQPLVDGTWYASMPPGFIRQFRRQGAPLGSGP